MADAALLERARLLEKAHALEAAQGDSFSIEPIESAAKTVGNGALRALDYLGGLGRTAIAGNPAIRAVQALRGKPGLVDTQTLKDALRGQAPRSDEFMARAGIPAGPDAADVLNQAGGDFPHGGPTLRSAAGFAADMATDPLNYAAGLGTLAKLSPKMLELAQLISKPGSTALDAAGAGLYRSAPLMKKLDVLVRDARKTAGPHDASTFLMNEGVGGSAKNISRQIEENLATEKGKLGSLYDEGDRVGAGNVYDPTRTTGEAQDVLDLINKQKLETPGTIAALEKLILDQKTRPQGSMSFKELGALKSATYDKTRKNAYAVGVDSTAPIKGYKAFAYGQKNELERAAEVAQQAAGIPDPQLANQLRETNGRIGSYYDVADEAQAAADRAHTRMSPSFGDVAAGGIAAAVHPTVETVLGTIALKKGADLSKTNLFRTRLGQVLRKGAQLPMDIPARRLLLNEMGPQASPYIDRTPQGEAFEDPRIEQRMNERNQIQQQVQPGPSPTPPPKRIPQFLPSNDEFHYAPLKPWVRMPASTPPADLEALIQYLDTLKK